MRAKNFSRTFDDKNFGDMVDFLNSLFQNGISISNNISGQIVQFQLKGNGEEVKVPHKLGTVPLYRIVLRQEGPLVIYDGEETWTDKFVTIRGLNTGAVAGTVTIPELRQTIGRAAFDFATPDSATWSAISSGNSRLQDTGVKLPQRTLNIDGGSVTDDEEFSVTMLLLRN